MTPLWISVDTALDIISSSGIPAPVANDQLGSALRAGDVQAKAILFYENKADHATERQVLLPATFWDYAQSKGFNLWWLPQWCEWNGRKSELGSLVQGIELPDADIRRIWPKHNAEKAAGGRATTHDWAAAAGFAAGYIVVNDYPSKADMVRTLVTWFSEYRGRSPDKREVERFVATLYEVEGKG